MMNTKMSDYDVIVIGAGLAGLTAAKALHEKGKKYLILEATDRAGGKVSSKVSEDSSRYFEQGAQFVNKDMTEIVKLIEEAGMTLEETHIPEDLVVISEKSREPIRFDFKDIPAMLREVAETESASQSLASLLDKHVGNKRKRQIIKSFVASETTVNSDYINAEALEDLVSRITTTNNELNYQASGPLSRVVRYLETINEEAIRYLEPVVKVKAIENGYILKTKNKTKYHAKALIMAVPPTAAARIEFSSSLAEHYDRYLKSYVDGAVIKMTFVYDDPFWREQAIKGKKRTVYGVIYAANEGVNVMDSSKAEGENRLTLFIGGDKAKELASVPIEVKEFFAKERLIEVFGDEAEMYKDYEISEWQGSPYCGGGYGAMVHYKGEPKAREHLKEPFNNLVFASTELGPQFPQFMEGAIRSGQYAAKRLVEEMQ
ncbi:flavin monoamine oxidase family protein [Alkalibacterium sp. f15]|uniref:flavin monoamine oxidase family protein n=1 Tax=Alkalibacterium sp. f15 TaxID=3414029 RepID=UPI003BF8E0AA